MSSGEGLANASAAASTSHGPYNKRSAALSTGEAKRLAEYILPGPPRSDAQGRLITDAQGLVSLEDKLEIALFVGENAVLEEAYVGDAGGCLSEMPT